MERPGTTDPEDLPLAYYTSTTLGLPQPWQAQTTQLTVTALHLVPRTFQAYVHGLMPTYPKGLSMLSS